MVKGMQVFFSRNSAVSDMSKPLNSNANRYLFPGAITLAIVIFLITSHISHFDSLLWIWAVDEAQVIIEWMQLVEWAPFSVLDNRADRNFSLHFDSKGSGSPSILFHITIVCMLVGKPKLRGKVSLVGANKWIFDGTSATDLFEPYFCLIGTFMQTNCSITSGQEVVSPEHNVNQNFTSGYELDFSRFKNADLLYFMVKIVASNCHIRLRV